MQQSDSGDGSDRLEFAREDEAKADSGRRPWKVLIVDDEEDVHRVTRLALSGLEFQRRKILCLSAYSAAEAARALAEHSDVAIVLLDVVMEGPESGLELAKRIRGEMRNAMVRIILRTGQPGRAPEGRVIVDYDINDYKAKTELTEQKLFTSVVSALRAYADLLALDKTRRGLEKIIEGESDIFELRSLKKLTSGILAQIVSLISIDYDALYCRISGFAATDSGGEFVIVSGTGKFEGAVDREIGEALPAGIRDAIRCAAAERKSMYLGDSYVGYFSSDHGSQNVVYVEGWDRLEDTERRLVEIFCSSASVAFDNLYLNAELEDSQREIIFTLGELVDMRSVETGGHVRRVGAYSRLLALKAGLSEEEAGVIAVASAMHDVGKLCIPDAILQKTGELSEDEFALMKIHPAAGSRLLKHSDRAILRTASVIAAQHHERYDGSGYPNGLAGEEIDIAARIAAIADVFDAIAHDRVYRKAMPREAIVEYFGGAVAAQFDPRLMAVFLGGIDEFYGLMDEPPL
jgi:response regulator RpfG family c-di-GMP phosphodiesterase